MLQWTGISLASAPASEPITVAEAKSHLRVDTSDDDTLIGDLIQSAREYLEDADNVALVSRKYDVAFDRFPDGNDPIVLPRAPLAGVTHVKYYGETGATSTLSSSNYQVDSTSKPGRILIDQDADWPTDSLRSGNGVVVRITAGYGAASAVPESFKSQIKLLVGDLYEHRGDTITGTIVNRIGAVDRLSVNRMFTFP